MNEFKHLRLNSSGPANNFTSAQRQAVSELKHFPARKRWLVPVCLQIWPLLASDPTSKALHLEDHNKTDEHVVRPPDSCLV